MYTKVALLCEFPVNKEIKLKIQTELSETTKDLGVCSFVENIEKL